MKKPTHLILDNFSHPGITMFWKRHGLSVMEQLVPNDFLFTTADRPLEKLVEKEIWSGWKKIILIGTPSSIRRSFNIIMSASEDCRHSLSVGFWPINFRTLTNYLIKSSLNLRPILQVFKAGHTIYVDIPKVTFHTSKKESKVFWKNFFINSTHNSSKTSISADDYNFVINGKFSCRIGFHDENLNSLTMHPGKLTRAPLLRVFLKQNISMNLKQNLFRKNKLKINFNIFPRKDNFICIGKSVLINGNWANLSMGFTEIKDTVESVKLEIKQKTLPMIIPAKPIYSDEKISNIIPKFRPSNVIVNNQKNMDNI